MLSQQHPGIGAARQRLNALFQALFVVFPVGLKPEGCQRRLGETLVAVGGATLASGQQSWRGVGGAVLLSALALRWLAGAVVNF